MHLERKIKILSPDQAIKIAAGEVVERPVNIIKEIVENSIDAQATKITIFIEKSGKQLIKIIDNGSGMSPEDAKLSIAQYATSKITIVEDLETIATFGFRGEALASINAVSKLTIITKTAEAQTGILLEWNFGKLHKETEASHPTGTTLEIKNLFDNIPARQKFLKKDETEWRAIITLFQAFCLDYPQIHFQLYNENKLQYNCPSTQKFSDRIIQLFDEHFQTKMCDLIPLENKLCFIKGAISKADYYRYDRNQIFVFVNNRWVKNIDLTKAIMKGYAGTLPPQKYPAAIIFINIDTTQVDVNIHPKKEEIKFLYPKKIEAIITNSIKATLDQSTMIANQNIAQKIQPFYQGYATHIELDTTNTTVDYRPTPIKSNKNDTTFDFLKGPEETFDYKNLTASSIFDQQIIDTPDIAAHQFEPITIKEYQKIKEVEQKPIIDNQEQVLPIIGQYKKTYIISEKDSNLILIDQHAAHERILYEEFKTNLNNMATIQLIFPEFIKLQAHDIMTISPYLELLYKHGISAQIFSETQLIVESTPIHLKNQLLQEIIHQIIGWIKDTDETDQIKIMHILHEKIHAKMACSAAIKAGDYLNFEQMQELLKKLNLTTNRFSCPHGRPIFLTIPIDFIEKKFKRNYEKKAEQFFDFL